MTKFSEVLEGYIDDNKITSYKVTNANALTLLSCVLRLASTEAFVLAGTIGPDKDAELAARIDYARAVLKSLEDTTNG